MGKGFLQVEGLENYTDSICKECGGTVREVFGAWAIQARGDRAP